jgi:hypothetical protein
MIRNIAFMIRLNRSTTYRPPNIDRVLSPINARVTTGMTEPIRNRPATVAVIQRFESATNRSTISTTQMPAAKISSGASA